MVSSQGVRGKASDHTSGLKNGGKAEKESGKTESASADEKKGASKKPSPSSKVSISEQGRKLGNKAGVKSDETSDGHELNSAAMEEKKNDLVNFYAKQLMKATDKLEESTPTQTNEASATNTIATANVSE